MIKEAILTKNLILKLNSLLNCPVCYNKYIGKTDRNIITRMDKHRTEPEQPMYQHYKNCAQFAEYLNFMHFII